MKGIEGPVFGSNDYWKGLGVFFDSFDNDGQVCTVWQWFLSYEIYVHFCSCCFLCYKICVNSMAMVFCLQDNVYCMAVLLVTRCVQYGSENMCSICLCSVWQCFCMNHDYVYIEAVYLCSAVIFFLWVVNFCG